MQNLCQLCLIRRLYNSRISNSKKLKKVKERKKYLAETLVALHAFVVILSLSRLFVLVHDTSNNLKSASPLVTNYVETDLQAGLGSIVIFVIYIYFDDTKT